MILNKNELFHKDLNLNGQVKLYIGKNKEQLQIIKNILNDYISFLNKQKEKQLLGLDFEFNKGTIAMAQLNLDKFTVNRQDRQDRHEIILLFDPTDKFITETFRKVVIHKNIWLILHGAESLDLPYLTKQLVKKPKDLVKMFQNLIDTKYLCDYILQEKEGRCKINFFLEQEGIISKEFLEDMLKNEKKMGPIYLVHVDIKNLKPSLLMYSAYDVIFLPELIRKVKLYVPFIEIVRITQINYMMKYNLLKKYDETKNIIGLVNNSYFPKLPQQNNKLTDIIPPIIEMAQSTQLEKLKLIPGFKKIIELIEKSFLYPIFINKVNLILINDKGKNIKPLELPKELEHIFKDLQENVTNMIN
jgi:hypothetical protein